MRSNSLTTIAVFVIMAQYFRIHPDNPQLRLVRQAVDIINSGGVIAYPTDTCYALGCKIGNKSALERIIKIRQLDKRHHFTIICRDLSDIATYAKVDNSDYRLLKTYLPGPYTFILKATSEVPRRLMHDKRKTIGLRVPAHPITQMLLEELSEPLMTTSLLLPGDEYPLTDPEDVRSDVGSQIDLVIDGGHGFMDATSVIDLVERTPEVIRVGLGDVSAFESP